MDLSVTIGMQKHKVGSLVRSALSLRKDVMDVPSCFLRYRPTTVRASALLLLPKMKQASFSLEIVLHDQAEPALEVFFPCWIERIGFTFDFDMAADRDFVAGISARRLFKECGTDLGRDYRGGLSCRSSFIPRVGATFPVSDIG